MSAIFFSRRYIVYGGCSFEMRPGRIRYFMLPVASSSSSSCSSDEKKKDDEGPAAFQGFKGVAALGAEFCFMNRDRPRAD